jgi:outer membrane murein-binding lipoprotein Lpp
MRKLILAAVVGTSFALAGCTGGEKAASTEAAVEATDTGSAMASDAAADSSSSAAESTTAAKM